MRKISPKQAKINKLYKAMLSQKEITFCSGCGTTKHLSPSHIISRQDCKNIGRPELIYDPDNVDWLCLSIGRLGCHSRWETPSERKELPCYDRYIDYIRKTAPELLRKYEVK